MAAIERYYDLTKIEKVVVDLKLIINRMPSLFNRISLTRARAKGYDAKSKKRFRLPFVR